MARILDTSLATKRVKPLTNIALEIGQEIQLEVNLADFLQKNKDKEATFNRNLEKRQGIKYRIAYTQANFRRFNHQRLHYSNTALIHLGARLIDLVVSSSCLFETKQVEKYTTVVPSDWLMKTWEKNAKLLEHYSHEYIPCVIKPAKWTNPWHGGYYGDLLPFATLLKKDLNLNSFARDYKKLLGVLDLTPIYTSLNGLQETPYKINGFILNTIREIVRGNGGLGGIPQTEPLPQLPPLTGDYTEQELREHRAKMSNIVHKERSRQGRMLRLNATLAAVQKYKQYEKIYFPWNLDYRGRCYCFVSFISPQGDDMGKSLLVFSEPTPCKNKDDWELLAIHGANCAGIDKVTFKDRIKWIKDNEEHILASAKDPIGYKWWSEVAENDSPFSFLAFCKEWERLQDYLKINDTCIGFKSNIAIAFDGSCSGLQHYSALLRDKTGGQAVNLTADNNQVSDIYQIVADKVNKKLLQDALEGTTDHAYTTKQGRPFVSLGTQTLARQWLMFSRLKFNQDGITRKVCKRSVMTLPYGSGKYGFEQNIIEDIITPFKIDYPDEVVFTNTKKAARYMAELIWGAIGKTVEKALEGMAYLKELARLTVKNKSVVCWSTPNGLPVQQHYTTYKIKQTKCKVSGKNHNLYIKDHDGNIDKKRQCQAIAPNYIHSLDATHLQMIVNSCLKEGITNFAFIHDSFGTDLGNARRLFHIIREEFVKLYDNVDHLERFTKEMSELIPKGTKLPEKPSFGTLDIKEVLKSDYCFA